MERPILFFDGECKFCNYSVHFVLRNELNKDFLFAHLQDENIQKYLVEKSNNPIRDSIYVLENGELFHYSEAAVVISKYLKKPYSFFQVSKVIPRFIRDYIYRLVAAIRLKLAGKMDQCIYPKELEGRVFNLS